MKWLKRIAIATAALILLVAVALWWLLGTTSGLHFALDRARSAMGGALQIGSSHGHLAGPLTVKDLRYRDEQGTDVRLKKATIDVSIWSLLGGTVRVAQLDASGIDAALPTEPAPEKPEPSGEFSLQPPIDIVLDDVKVRDLTVSKADQTLVVMQQILLGASWTSSGLKVSHLDVRSPDGRAAAQGELVLGGHYSGQGEADFAWDLGQNRLTGSLHSHGDGEQATVKLNLTSPLAAQVEWTVRQQGDYPWAATLKLPRADVSELLGDGTIQTLSADLEVHGDRKGGTLTGTVQANDWPLRLAPLDIALSEDRSRLDIRSLQLESARVPGTVSATGQVQLDADPLHADLSLKWQGVQLPAELVGQELASAGQLQFSGSAQEYQLAGELDAGPPGELSHLQLELNGTDREVTIRHLTLQQPEGQVEVSGQLLLKPALQWQLKADGTRFDPGAFLADWPGALNFSLSSTGQQDGGLDARVEIEKLGGTLRDRAVEGEGKLHWSPSQVVDGTLDIAIGESHIKLRAEPGEENDLRADIDIISLADWLPDAAGAISGKARMLGPFQSLDVSADLGVENMRWQSNKIGNATLDVQINNLAAPSGEVHLQASKLELAGLVFDQLDVEASGNQASHKASIAARGPQVSLALAAEGGMQGDVWQGELTRLDLEPQSMPGWYLTEPSRIRVAGNDLDLSRLCLNAGDPSLCVEARRSKGRLLASYQLNQLPFGLLAALIPEQAMPVRVDGVLQGQGELQQNANGDLVGHAELSSEQGSVTWLDNPRRPLLGWTGFRVNADLDGQDQAVEVHASLTDNGSLDGRITVQGAQRQLSGRVEMKLDSLGFVELLTDSVAEVQGDVEARVQLAGSMDQPQVTGDVQLSQFSAVVPATGMKIVDGQIQARTGDDNRVLLEGSLKSGDGDLQVAGQIGLDTDSTTRVTLEGHQFLVADIPAARVVISPKLEINKDTAGIDLTGLLAIDEANVDISKLPGGGSTQASPDVVVMDAPATEEQAALPLRADITVDLGDNTRLAGLGLDGRLTGRLDVHQRPGKSPTGEGQIEVGGSYSAYGQDLQIEQGQLLFAGTPLANPGLNIRAVRDLNPNATIDQGQEVGLDISGTAQRPVLTVFSDPVMSQADALSYLVTGKPLSQVKGGEGNMVGAAAQALGSATGDLLAKSVGSKLGLDMGVSSSQALGGGAAFTVGKYLSPQLYLNYGVGLFEPGTVITLRYIFSPNWNFEAIQATNFSRAALNYRYER